jgi:Effector-associated domain 1
MLLADAGLNASAIHLSRSAEQDWFEVIEEAEKCGLVRALLAEALEHYANDRELTDLGQILLGAHDIEVRAEGTADEEIAVRPGTRRVDFADIAEVLRDLHTMLPEQYDVIEPVPDGKLDANHIGTFNRRQVEHGMVFSPVVSRYFESNPDQEYGERVAAEYRTIYRRYRGMGLPPREIYNKLYTFTCGLNRGTPQAVAAVLAYFFERCDIFEGVPGEDIPRPGPAATDGRLARAGGAPKTGKRPPKGVRA